jgi:hypothetical protein
MAMRVSSGKAGAGSLQAAGTVGTLRLQTDPQRLGVGGWLVLSISYHGMHRGAAAE